MHVLSVEKPVDGPSGVAVRARELDLEAAGAAA